MAKHRMDVTTFVGKLLEQEDVDALREGVKVLAQALMEAEVSSQIGADRNVNLSWPHCDRLMWPHPSRFLVSGESPKNGPSGST